MAKRVTDKDIYEINCAYLKHGTYSAAARETGWSPNTVKKYIVEGFTPNTESKKLFTSANLGKIEKKTVDEIFKNPFLSSGELEELEGLWDEIPF